MYLCYHITRGEKIKMKLNEWCRKQGINYHTGYRWFKKGLIPNARQISTGTILVDEVENRQNDNKAWIYCRVSNSTRKTDLDNQIQRCKDFCLARGYEIVKIHKEIASGMNDSRRELWRLLDKKPTRIVVEHKDRLTRFGFEYLDRLLKRLGCELIVINRDDEDESDLIKDLVSIISSFCCRLYGLRRGKKKTKEMKELLND